MTMTTTTRVLTLGAFALAACAPSPDAEPAQSANAPTDAVPVTIATATVGSLNEAVEATGTFGPRDEIPLSFKIGGVIAQVGVDQGAVIRKGQTLAALDLREIDAAVTKARIGVEKAERDVARLTRLVTDSVATTVQLQDATSALDAARADLTTARVNREYATIVAPEDGVVLTRLATAGTTIGAGVPVLTIGGSRRGRVLRAGLPDRDALRVRLGDDATVTFDALPAQRFRGVVTLLAQAADGRTGTYAVEVQLREASTLPAGLVGRVTISPRRGNTATLIPVDALIEASGDSATIYTVSATTPPRATAHRVLVLRLVGDRAAIVGVDSGAHVIARGAAYVREGSPVQVTTAPESARRPGGAP